MGLLVQQIAVGGYDNNFSYVVYDVTTKNAAIVDPCGDLEKVLQVVGEAGLDLVGVLLTHTHHDHFDKLDELLRQYALPVHVHKLGLQSVVAPSPLYGVRDRETLVLGSSQVLVLHTPGHSEDSVCFVVEAAAAEDGVAKVITGDTLFVEGCGRTNKDGVQALYNSLIRLKALPANCEVYPGHDYGSVPVSTIAHEKEFNRYLRAADFETFKKLRLAA